MDLDAIRAAVRQDDILVTAHALAEAISEGIDVADVWRSFLDAGTSIVEDYPTDPRGASCLILSLISGDPIHSVIAYPSKRHAAARQVSAVAVLVTVYRPDLRPHETIEPASQGHRCDTLEAGTEERCRMPTLDELLDGLQCPRCRRENTYVPRSTDFTAKVGMGTITVGVIAGVCTNCGKQLLDAVATRKVSDAVRRLREGNTGDLVHMGEAYRFP
jgi:YgiT-type zinc finger domain-containing protein